MSSTKPVAITSAGQNGEADLFLLSLKLNSSGRTNVLEWLDKLGSVLGAKHGFAASVLFATFKNYSIPAPDLDFSGEGMPEWTVEQLEILQADALKAFLKDRRDLPPKLNMLYHDMWMWISLESRQRIDADSRSDQMHLTFNPEVLMTLIRETHLTNVASGAFIDKAMESLSLQTEFLTMAQQPGVSISVHKKKFDDVYKTYLEGGGTKLSEEQVVLRFLTSLDGSRHRDMCVSIENQRKLGIARPATLAIAYATASSWKSTTLAPGSNAADFNAVYLCTDDVPAVSVLLVPPTRAVSTYGKRGGKKTTTVSTATTAVGEDTAATDTRPPPICHLCYKPGHIKRNCPKYKVVLINVAQGDEAENPDSFHIASQATFMVADVSSSQCCVLFTDTEIVLDNAAGQSVFRNPALLHAIVSTPGQSLGGVNSQSPRLVITAKGEFGDLGAVGVSKLASANILSQGQAMQDGARVRYDDVLDRYYLQKPAGKLWAFDRKLDMHGRKTNYWVHDTVSSTSVLTTTVHENLRRYTKREVKQMFEAKQLQVRLGYMNGRATVNLLNAGVLNCSVTATDVRNHTAAAGGIIAEIRGKTRKMTSTAASGSYVAPRVTQVQQSLAVDICYIKGLAFLIGKLSPLGLGLALYLKDRTTDSVGKGIRSFLSTATSRSFECKEIRTDGEGAVAAMVPELNGLGIPVSPSGPGQHVSPVERFIQEVKKRARSHEHGLPFVMCKVLLIYCVLFCVRCINMQASTTSIDHTSPLEQFSGMKLDAKRDLRVGFGDYVEATVPNTDNTMAARTEGCIALLPTGNLTGSVHVWRLASKTVMKRDQFRILPTPDTVITHLNKLAALDGYSRGFDPTQDHQVPEAEDVDEDDENFAALPPLPEMMPIDGRPDVEVPVLPTQVDLVPAAGVVEASTPTLEHQLPQEYAVRRSERIAEAQRKANEVILIYSEADESRAALRRHLLFRSNWIDKDFAFHISVRAALRERPEEARPVIMAELQQMVDKGVWHGIKASSLSIAQRRAIIRSSMFLKDKYSASGAFDKFKARLVAGGDQQDKGLYENLSSPTASTSSVLTVAAIAASEGRSVITIYIGGAFLNADIAPTGIQVHMRLDRVMTQMLMQIDPTYQQYVEADGSMVVQLDKALYGCVEAAALWYADLRSKLEKDGFVANPYDACVLNKLGADGVQITIAVHVDDLLVTSSSNDNLASLERYLQSVFPAISVHRGDVLDYIGMTFDFTVQGEVSITMENCVRDILSECGVTLPRATPAAETLFEVRSNVVKVSPTEAAFFHTYVMKILYLAKRVRPECLTAVSFLTTRVHDCDIDDMAKLKRLLGYLLGTRDRGIILRIGEHMAVRAFIDAAYGVHTSSGKSHTGCAIVLGDAGALSCKSTKQKIVTKSSTEAELVGLSDTATQAIHLRNFVQAQGYEVGPAIIYQDNMSCMALMKRGGPGSERSRHINIRHFWLCEKVKDGEVVIEHLGTEKMFANALTKPVQGQQFVQERRGLTNWD